MALNPQDRLGPYEIVGLLGQGGMGEVYSARDTRLNRHVAIKVLRGDNSTAAGARFEREAQAVAALNHPNIVALFEIGRENGVEFTVSELVEGRNLRKVLEAGPLTVRQTVDYAAQIADGLAAAHAAGIVHRDLKPENVMVTTECRIKILDFGLARQGAAPVFGAGASSSGETMAVVMDNATEYRTTPGMVLGTATYMSPEQARGEEADYRSDQFSLGLIVYEMLSGRPAFPYPSAIETMAAIVRDDPAPLPESVKAPAPLLWILERLLEKDRRNRFDSTRDLYGQLRAIDTHWSSMSGTSVHTAIAAPVARRAWLPGMSRGWIAAALAAGLALGAAAAWLLHPRQLDLSAYSYHPFAFKTSHNAVWSPDGQSLLYAAHVKDATELFLGKDGQNPLQLTHLGSYSRALAFSGDGVHVFFYSNGAEDSTRGIYRVSTVGGDPERIMAVPEHFNGLTVAPGGSAAALLGSGQDGSNTILISAPLGTQWREYTPAPFRPLIKDTVNDPLLAFSPDGKKLLMVVNGNAGEETDWMLPWPSGSGTPKQIRLDIPRFFFTPDAAWMPDSEHLLVATTPDGVAQHLFMGKPGGSFRQITMGAGYETRPAVSPDGRTVAYVTGNNDFNIVAIAIADGTVSGLVETPRDESMPAWSTGSDLMAYVTDRNGKQEIWLHASDGTERAVVRTSDLPGTVVAFMDPVPSPDGQRIAYTVICRDGSIQLWISPVSGGTPVRVTSSAKDVPEMSPYWSPDGSRLVFLGGGAGVRELDIASSSGAATPTALYRYSNELSVVMPAWVPGTDRILTGDGKNLFTVSSHGGKPQALASRVEVEAMAVTKDGKTGYAIRMEGHTPVFFSLDLTTHAMHDIKRLPPEDEPASNLNPGVLLTFSPDGKTLAYTTGTNTSSIWLLRGFPQP